MTIGIYSKQGSKRAKQRPEQAAAAAEQASAAPPNNWADLAGKQPEIAAYFYFIGFSLHLITLHVIVLLYISRGSRYSQSIILYVINEMLLFF